MGVAERSLRSNVIRDVRLPEWINLPRAEYVLPVLAGVGLALLFFFLQKDLGPALFLCCVFLAVYAVARGRIGMAVAGFLLLVLGFYVGYRLNVSATLAERVRMWQSPWDNAVAGGDQVAQAIWAMATGGLVRHRPRSRRLPLSAGRATPISILAAIGEELGAVGLTIVAVLYAIVAWRGIRIGTPRRNDYGFFLATALTLFLIVPVLIMASGIAGRHAADRRRDAVSELRRIGDGRELLRALGMLASIHADRHPSADFEPFRVPIDWLEGALGVFALALLAVMINIQIVHADDYVVKPHLGVQADGGRRFAYNPRVLDIVRLAAARDGLRPSGSAAGDRRSESDRERRVRRTPGSASRWPTSCPDSAERCYPLGGSAFHLLGDARTRVNWSAPNTSYVERDAEDRLRGFDDHAATMHTTRRRPAGRC